MPKLQIRARRERGSRHYRLTPADSVLPALQSKSYEKKGDFEKAIAEHEAIAKTGQDQSAEINRLKQTIAYRKESKEKRQLALQKASEAEQQGQRTEAFHHSRSRPVLHVCQSSRVGRAGEERRLSLSVGPRMLNNHVQAILYPKAYTKIRKKMKRKIALILSRGQGAGQKILSFLSVGQFF